MYIDIDRFFSALLWVAFAAMWGWMIFIFCTLDQNIGLAGLIGMCGISVLIAVSNFVSCFWRDDDEE